MPEQPEFQLKLSARITNAPSEVDIWIGWRGGVSIAGLKLLLSHGANIALPPTDQWDWVGPDPAGDRGVPTRHRIERVKGLLPGKLYSARIDFGSAVLNALFGASSRIEFRTPRTALPPSGSAESFTVMFGSCAGVLFDPWVDTVTAVRRIREATSGIDFTFLLGDQVYIDQPAGLNGPFTRERSSAAMRDHAAKSYRQTWNKLGPLLDGPVAFVPDDHDYWNDYPSRPNTFAWPGLQKKEVRDRLAKVMKEHADAFQHPSPVRVFDVGRSARSEVSFCLVDTRTDRDDLDHPNASGKFMHESDFETVLGWISTLECPGVLLTSSPILISAKSTKKVLFYEDVTDWNLPAFSDQYPRLVEAILHAPHDIAILTGDVHFGQVRRFQFPDAIGFNGPRNIVEVVSSPIAMIAGAPGDPADRPARLRRLRPIYGPTVLGRSGPSKAKRGPDSIGHLATAEFQRGSGNSVEVTIKYWSTIGPATYQPLLLASDDPSPGDRLLTYRFTLGAGETQRPVEKERRLVTHVAREGLVGRIVAIGNPGQPWSPRPVHEAITDVLLERAEYLLDLNDASSSLVVARNGDSLYLRARPLGSVLKLAWLPLMSAFERNWTPAGD